MNALTNNTSIFDKSSSTEIFPNSKAELSSIRVPGTPCGISYDNVKIIDGFWSPRQKQVICTTIRAAIKQVETPTGGIPNFINAAKKNVGQPYEKVAGAVYVDSDVHKVLEAMIYALAFDPEGDAEMIEAQEFIRSKLEAWMPYYVGTQEESGYFNAFHTLSEKHQKWENFNNHELYCAGHFYEAAIAHYVTTGGEDTRLFDIAIKNADHICTIFGRGEGQIIQVPGHQEIELALIRLAELCRSIGVRDGIDHGAKAEKYLALSQFFLDERGRDRSDRYGIQMDGSLIQDDVPLTELTRAYSHAVRAGYMYTAMAEMAMEKDSDMYNRSLINVWKSAATKTYATGGVGVEDHHEGYGDDYYMPLDKSYCETCAGIANLFWNSRMNLMFGESRYADIMEQVLYNVIISCVSLDGDRFFYQNYVSTEGRERFEWVGTACCPSNFVRFIMSLGSYIYAQNGDEITLNLYIGNEADLSVSGGALRLSVDTEFPNNGKTAITVNADGERHMALRLRVPAWATGRNTVSVNGKAYDVQTDTNGYAVIDRVWSDGDKVELYFTMEVQPIDMIEGVSYTENYTAFRRGPIVYCAEKTDNQYRVDSYYIDGEAEFTEEWTENIDGKADPLGIRGLYKMRTNDAKVNYFGEIQNAELTLIPVYAAFNREKGGMEVYVSAIEKDSGTLEYLGRPSASITYFDDNVNHLNDGHEAKNGERNRWTSYQSDRVVPSPWVMYTFDQPVKIGVCLVKWYDDGGGVRLPNGLIIEYWNENEWVAVEGLEDIKFSVVGYNEYKFDTVTTEKIRMTMQNDKTSKACGIVEWKLK